MEKKPIPYRVITEDSAKRPRGRPTVFSDEALRRAARFSYARRVRTRRGAQDLVYRQFAIAAIELYREAYGQEAAQLDWLLGPTPRHSLLTELGRVAHPRANEDGVFEWSTHDVSELIRAALMVSVSRPRTKEGIKMIRDFRRPDRASAS
jgi:hypothetical protein